MPAALPAPAAVGTAAADDQHSHEQYCPLPQPMPDTGAFCVNQPQAPTPGSPAAQRTSLHQAAHEPALLEAPCERRSMANT